MCSSQAADLLKIDISNSRRLAQVRLVFSTKPVYVMFPLHQPDRIVFDIYHSTILCGIPHIFSQKNILKCIRASAQKHTRNIRLVFNVSHSRTIKVLSKPIGTRYHVLCTISLPQPVPKQSIHTKFSKMSMIHKLSIMRPNKKHVNSPLRKIDTIHHPSSLNCTRSKIIVAIDAGHGGQDPGAIGRGGSEEKDITISIARKLKKYLDSDPMFTGVMTRYGDNFISVQARSEIAHKKKANILISIHTDSARNYTAAGASAWVLSNRRANHEMANWFKKHEKTSQVVGKTHHFLLNNVPTDRYLHQALLDLQFSHSQRVGYDVAAILLSQLQNICTLHHRKPAYASFGVLRSPYIPSLLIEIGFISNPTEEKLLGSLAYQKKMAQSIYQGLHTYFVLNPPFCTKRNNVQLLQPMARGRKGQQLVIMKKKPPMTHKYHVIQNSKYLVGIASDHQTQTANHRLMQPVKRSAHVHKIQRIK
ncbi:N-acetylmuramoyl-L-alanine amidase [Candidatus Erwinia haradaeae]|uniref:N-acetylmuramoyl-L-alanine amidase n=1 Tax=Candidatus Erwinia haradaeae TaxID=1922217 RepID=UPI001300420E|nr:N-acetylmuramoyl-L-alanine amidase [Candidatus Erwinia haradaeae]